MHLSYTLSSIILTSPANLCISALYCFSYLTVSVLIVSERNDKDLSRQGVACSDSGREMVLLDDLIGVICNDSNPVVVSGKS